MRRLLVQSAHYMLGPFGKDRDLRRFGLRLVSRGGRAAKKRAAVARANSGLPSGQSVLAGDCEVVVEGSVGIPGRH